MGKGNHKKGLLWKISTNGTAPFSYVLGTMHVQDIRAFVVFHKALMLMGKVKVFVPEMNLNEASQDVTNDQYFLPDEQKLEDWLRPKFMMKLDRFFRIATGLSISRFNRHKPVLIVNMMAEAFLRKDLQVSLDARLLQEAEIRDMTIIGLERFEEQANTLEALDLSAQFRYLKSAIQKYTAFRKSTLDAVKLYQDEDVYALYKLTKKSLGKSRHVLLHSRNKLMAERMISLHHAHPCFFAIGAAHLAGKGGIFERLKKDGLAVSLAT